MNAALRRVRSRTVVLPTDNVDTDQIIPARFLLVTTRDGLGAGLFADWRYDAEGRPRPDFALNRREAEGARVLVVGRNFGCGSSREHAAWALVAAGFQAVIGPSFADIFRANALKNGLVPVQLAPDAHARLVAQPGAEVEIDLGSLTVTLPDATRAAFGLDPFARHCLMEGIDELGFLLAQAPAIATFENRRPMPMLRRK
jgi:3-isopropylmalate/(R)-2-methylmalate dehydratase small subunit